MQKLLTTIYLLITLLMVSGCASDAYVKIYALGAEGGYGLIGDVVAGGCLVFTKGEVQGGMSVSYQGKDCQVAIGKVPAPPVEIEPVPVETEPVPVETEDLPSEPELPMSGDVTEEEVL